MSRNLNNRRLVVAAIAVAFLGGCTQMHSMMHGGGSDGGTTERVTLSGGNEVPPVSTSASASGTVTVHADHTVMVDITVSGMTPTAAHIHEGPNGANGPVIVPLNKVGDNKFTTAPGAKLSDSQFDSYKSGHTYINVHSAGHPGGEIRAQLAGR